MSQWIENAEQDHILLCSVTPTINSLDYEEYDSTERTNKTVKSKLRGEHEAGVWMNGVRRTHLDGQGSFTYTTISKHSNSPAIHS